ncbi:hypothetical protein [Parasphingorhabdus sp.]|uniref:hypothetical protein n=1 Tax=Parasphingorhabdus sp. TaxID=2709688 RepID=UPI003003088D
MWLKYHVYKIYGAPTVTFEIGDETDRQLIIRLAREAAIAMMESLQGDKDGEVVQTVKEHNDSVRIDVAKTIGPKLAGLEDIENVCIRRGS